MSPGALSFCSDDVIFIFKGILIDFNVYIFEHIVFNVIILVLACIIINIPDKGFKGTLQTKRQKNTKMWYKGLKVEINSNFIPHTYMYLYICIYIDRLIDVYRHLLYKQSLMAMVLMYVVYVYIVIIYALLAK